MRQTDSASTGDTREPALLHEAKVRAELIAADRHVPGSDTNARSGSLSAAVMVVKGDSGPAEAGSGVVMSGRDGEALAKALVALGFDPDDTSVLLSRPVSDASDDAIARRVRWSIEAIDPWLIIALDRTAGDDVARGFGVTPLSFGIPTELYGRTVVVLSGFEGSLDDEKRKRVVWQQLQTIGPRKPVW